MANRARTLYEPPVPEDLGMACEPGELSGVNLVESPGDELGVVRRPGNLGKSPALKLSTLQHWWISFGGTFRNTGKAQVWVITYGDLEAWFMRTCRQPAKPGAVTIPPRREVIWPGTKYTSSHALPVYVVKHASLLAWFKRGCPNRQDVSFDAVVTAELRRFKRPKAAGGPASAPQQSAPSQHVKGWESED